MICIPPSLRMSCSMSSGLNGVAVPWPGKKNISLATAISSHHGHLPAAAR